MHDSIKEADMMAIGSILPRVEKSKRFGFLPRRMHVWGAGTNQRDLSISGRHYYHAVRGEKSLIQLQGEHKNVAFGDPGLLVSLMAEKCKPSNHKKLGLIPHYIDKEHKNLSVFMQNKSSKIIDVYDHPEKVISEIRRCEFIISSSMHGLIIADAFGIPNVRVVLRESDLDSYKFEDYYSIYDGVGNEFISAFDDNVKEFVNIDYESIFDDYNRLRKKSDLNKLNSVKQ